jgi:hypothetical protein
MVKARSALVEGSDETIIINWKDFSIFPDA